MGNLRQKYSHQLLLVFWRKAFFDKSAVCLEKSALKSLPWKGSQLLSSDDRHWDQQLDSSPHPHPVTVTMSGIIKDGHGTSRSKCEIYKALRTNRSFSSETERIVEFTHHVLILSKINEQVSVDSKYNLLSKWTMHVLSILSGVNFTLLFTLFKTGGST